MSRTRNLGKMISGNANLPTAHIDSDFTVHSNLFHVDAETDKVGIGTTSPDALLRVTGTSGSPQLGVGAGSNAIFVNSFDNNPIYMTASTTNSTGFGIGSASNIPTFFMTNNTERVHITSNGNVGIGTNNPSETLTVEGHALTSGDYHHWFEQVKYWYRDPGAGSYDANESTAMVSTSTVRVPPGNSGMIPIASINTRAFQNYVCVKTNWTADNLMFQLRYQGYMYGYSIADAHAGGYTYGIPANSVISKTQYETGSGSQFIADTYRTSEGHLCFKIFLGQVNYTEGVGTLWFGGHGDSWRDIQVLAVQIRNDGANHPF